VSAGSVGKTSLLPPPLPLTGVQSGGQTGVQTKLSAREANNHTVVAILNSARRSINANTMDPHAANYHTAQSSVHIHSGKNQHNITGSVEPTSVADATHTSNTSLKSRRKSKEMADAKIDLNNVAIPQMFPPVQTGSHHHSQSQSQAQAQGSGRVISPTSGRILRPCKYDQLVALGTQSQSHMAPSVLEELKQYLTPYEYTEIKEFPGTLYYLGLRGAKLVPRQSQPQAPAQSSQKHASNSGVGPYDDESGSYIATNRGTVSYC
jgi:hypothetical protein